MTVLYKNGIYTRCLPIHDITLRSAEQVLNNQDCWQKKLLKRMARAAATAWSEIITSPEEAVASKSLVRALRRKRQMALHTADGVPRVGENAPNTGGPAFHGEPERTNLAPAEFKSPLEET